VVNNYNYEGFLREAVDSALGQTHPRTEVVVVDDGSADGSRGIIASYGDRALPVLKENGGQGSALNAGFAAARGEIVIFLDADDVLLPETASRAAAAFRERPELVKVHYRLRVVDAAGVPTGETVPAAREAMPDWDRDGRQDPDPVGFAAEFSRTPRMPTSAVAYRASALRRILPMPAEAYRISADGYLNYLSPVLGPAASLDGIGGLYRVHGKNHYRARGIVNLDRLRDGLVRTARSYEEQGRLFESLHGHALPDAGSRNMEFLKERMISSKLDPTRHPFEDRAPVLAVRGAIAAFGRFGGLRARLLYALWFVLMLLAPRKLAGTLAVLAQSNEERRGLREALLRPWRGMHGRGSGPPRL